MDHSPRPSLFNQLYVRPFFSLVPSLRCPTFPVSLRVQVTTWNVNQKSPPDDITRLLGLQREPDIIAIGLQEVAISPHAIVTDEWTMAIDETLQSRGYTKIKTVAMVGIILNVYAQDRHNSRISVLDSAKVKTGCMGLWGNKGGVALSIRIYGSPVSFVAAHFHDGEPHLEERVDDYHLIEVCRERSISQEDYTFWMGDFNFRLQDETNYTPERIQDLVQKGNLWELLQKDQLNEVRGKGRAFKHYTEQPIAFKPTYRYCVGTSTYDLQRRPAWTDRVLYRAAPGREITPVHYDSISNMEVSDHKPVEAVFHITVTI